MRRRICRRDFLNGMAWAAASLAGSRGRARAAARRPGASSHSIYPPSLTGLRGAHPGSFEIAHELRDDAFWDNAGEPADTGERYELAVVGGGVSGLAAAHFFRKSAGARARVLILDNHDDFGGHCKRNEFTVAGRTILAYGGGHAIDSPAPYSAVARGLIEELGVPMAKSEEHHDRRLYGSLGLGRGVFFDKETFGADRLLPDPLGDFGGEANDLPPAGRDPWPRFLAEAPLPEAARRALFTLCSSPTRYLEQLTPAARRSELERTSYLDFLTRVAAVPAKLLPFLQKRTHALFGLGIDAVAAYDAASLGLPGFRNTELDGVGGSGEVESHGGQAYFYHFPDGNASIARLLVRTLVPGALPGRTAEDSVTARLDYARLDAPAGPVRIRLESTAVRVRQVAPGGPVEVAYVRDGKLQSIRAERCVLACWNGVIPYLCPELPGDQAQALGYGVKVPLVYTNVLVRSWAAFAKLGVSSIHAPGGFHSTVDLGRPVRVGGYRSATDPKEPMALHLVRTPCMPGLPARQQHRAGRVELLSTPFATFEREVRSQLGRILGPGGFDPARDILALTVNRWPHGYSYEYSTLWDAEVMTGPLRPCELGRRPFGRIAIANADAAGRAYLDAAIDEARRAIREVMAAK
ncbi:MAG: NAD(P)/FAD-dependent oxidoreductase [Candidatus Wallbacteria bacterium]|nr:NAD(P)/FAD-dependent oxidoreductase [Candidatus Wallbacteria bacterium]